MSVSLTCANCGKIVGEANHEDNYVEKYYYMGKNGEPICPTCGDDNGFKYMIIFWGVILVIGIIVIIISSV